MRTWIRTRIDTFCGRCGETIPRGSAAQEIRLIGQLVNRRTGEIGPDIDVTDRKLRCEKCADGRAPADLPVVPVQTPIAPKPKLKTFSGVAAMARDWKIKQAGE